MSSYLAELFKDPGFMGALLGAIITGSIGLVILLIQIKNQNKKEKKNELKFYFKSMFEFVHVTTDSLKRIEESVEKIKNQDKNASNALVHISRSIDLIEEEHGKIDSHAVPADIYPTFLSITIATDILKIAVEDVYEDIEKNRHDKVSVQGLTVGCKILKDNINVLKEKQNVAEKLLEIK